jgi:hypothetical protein
MPEAFNLVLLLAMIFTSGFTAGLRIMTYLLRGITPHRFPWLWTAVTVLNYPLGNRSNGDWTLWSIGREAGAR